MKTFIALLEGRSTAEVTRRSEIDTHARMRKFAKLAANKTGGLILRALQGVKQELFCAARKISKSARHQRMVGYAELPDATRLAAGGVADDCVIDLCQNLLGIRLKL